MEEDGTEFWGVNKFHLDYSTFIGNDLQLNSELKKHNTQL